MLESMEGRRAMPRLRPPFPAQVGYLGRPTLINNVETLAHLPAILRNGGEWWAALGTRGGRRNAALVHLRRSGAARLLRGAERDNDARARRRSTRAASRARSGAIVPGGAASGILPPSALDAPLTRDGLREYGAGVGSAARPGLPRVLLAAAAARRDDALLRRGVVPEVHALPDRKSRAPPSLRGARARARADDAREGRRVAARDGEDLDLRPRPGLADSRCETRCGTGPSSSRRSRGQG